MTIITVRQILFLCRRTSLSLSMNTAGLRPSLQSDRSSFSADERCLNSVECSPSTRSNHRRIPSTTSLLHSDQFPHKFSNYFVSIFQVLLIQTREQGCMQTALAMVESVREVSMAVVTAVVVISSLLWLLRWRNEEWFTRGIGYRLPPRSMGWPVIGEMIDFLWYFKFMKRPDDIIEKRKARLDYL